MKIKSMLLSVLLVAGLSQNVAYANVRPVVESFTFTPSEVELFSADTKAVFELVVSHPSGIDNLATKVSLTSSRGDTLSLQLIRTDSPVNTTLNKVTFKGTLSVPRDIYPGVYSVTADSVKNNASAGYQYETGTIISGKVRNIVGAENGLVVRSNGEINLVYDTFVGPSYDNTLGIAFNDVSKFNYSNTPIWKVGEVYNPTKYFELRVPSLSISVSSSTSTVCSSNGKELALLKEGTCSFVVFTAKTNDYVSKTSNQTVTVTSARTKAVLAVEKIVNQTSKNLPKSIEIGRVYFVSEGYVLPKSTTQSICLANGFFVRIVSGGTCTLTYQTAETANYLASDIYTVSFEVTRDPQTISFTLPSTLNISSKSLALTSTASSGAAVTYSTTSTGICSITGSTLNLLTSGNCAVTATQAGTSTLAPASATATVMLTGAVVTNKKSITCVKGKSTKKVSGTNPKCPKGYKLKK
jgi:hypothetical protein